MVLGCGFQPFGVDSSRHKQFFNGNTGASGDIGTPRHSNGWNVKMLHTARTEIPGSPRVVPHDGLYPQKSSYVRYSILSVINIIYYNIQTLKPYHARVRWYHENTICKKLESRLDKQAPDGVRKGTPPRDPKHTPKPNCNTHNLGDFPKFC